jgi:hypothetical protein
MSLDGLKWLARRDGMPEPTPKQLAAAVVEVERELAARAKAKKCLDAQAAEARLAALAGGPAEDAAAHRARSSAALAADELEALSLARTRLDLALTLAVQRRQSEERTRLRSERNKVEAEIAAAYARLRELVGEVVAVVCRLAGEEGRAGYLHAVVKGLRYATEGCGQPQSVDFARICSMGREEIAELAVRGQTPEEAPFFARGADADAPCQRQRLADVDFSMQALGRKEALSDELGGLLREARG